MNFSQRIPFETLMEPVALRLLGEPNKALSKYPTDMRWGTHGSLSVNFAKGVFCNYELGLSGGVVDFLKWLNACDTAAAMEWLEENHLLNGKAPQFPPLTALANKSRKLLERYDYTDENGKVIGEFKYTGIRPRFLERVLASGSKLDTSIFEQL